jgi:hypothetical protein
MNKKIKILLIVVAVILVLFIGIKIFNSGRENCNVDSDCVSFGPECCGGCGKGDAVNKFYLSTLKLEKFSKCLFVNENMCPMVDCASFYQSEAYCNQDNKCDWRANCEKTCARYERSNENITYIKKFFKDFNINCECNFE